MKGARLDPHEACLLKAGSQRGLITAAQAIAAGLTRRAIQWRLDSKRWQAALPGVYVITEARDPWLQELEAMRLWTGDAVITGRSSGALWSFAGLPRGVLEIATSSRKRHPRVIVHHRMSYASEDLVRHRGLLVTTPTRTLIDLGGILDEEVLAGAFDSALREGLTFIPLMRKRLEEIDTRGRRGVARIRKLLHEREVAAGLTESPLEVRVERALRRHGLEPPQRQYCITCPDGTRFRIDFAWPEQKVGIEADGFRWHSDFNQWQRDARRHNLLQEMGWRIVRATDRSLRQDPDALPRQVAGLLGHVRLPLEA